MGLGGGSFKPQGDAEIGDIQRVPIWKGSRRGDVQDAAEGLAEIQQMKMDSREESDVGELGKTVEAKARLRTI